MKIKVGENLNALIHTSPDYDSDVLKLKMELLTVNEQILESIARQVIANVVGYKRNLQEQHTYLAEVMIVIGD